MSSSESDAPRKRKASNVAIEKALRAGVARCYKNDDLENLTIKRVRAAVEKQLKLDEGYLKADESWNEKSKKIVNDEVAKWDAGNGKEVLEDGEKTKKTTKPKAKPAAKKMEPKPAPKSKQKAKAKPKKRTSSSELSEIEEEDEEEDDYESSPPPPKKQSKRAQPAQRGKRKSEDGPVKPQKRQKRVATPESGEEEHDLSDDDEKASPPPAKESRTSSKTQKAPPKAASPLAKTKKSTQRIADSDEEGEDDDVVKPNSEVEEEDDAHNNTREEKAQATDTSALTPLPTNDPSSESDSAPVKAAPKLQPSASAPVDDSDDYSDVLDEPAPTKKRSKSTSSAPRERKPSASKTTAPASKAKESAPTDSSEEEIKRLQSHLVKCGIRKVWSREFTSNSLTTPRDKIAHLKRLLKDVGMEGRFSEEKARKIKEEREFKRDLEEIKEGNEAWGMSGDEDDDGQDGSGEPRKRLARGLKDLAAFEGDEESD